jgi:hypothetical protein
MADLQGACTKFVGDYEIMGKAVWTFFRFVKARDPSNKGFVEKLSELISKLVHADEQLWVSIWKRFGELPSNIQDILMETRARVANLKDIVKKLLVESGQHD